MSRSVIIIVIAAPSRPLQASPPQAAAGAPRPLRAPDAPALDEDDGGTED
ncbi:hypothetical protein [Streptomyces sp. OE57]